MISIIASINKFLIRFGQCLSIIKMSRDPTCDVNMHILENPRWRTARVFQLKYLSSEARYEKSEKLVISKALLNEQRIFFLAIAL